MTPDLVLTRVTVGAGARPLLAEVSLQVRPGALVALIGANGAGKTTLLRAALGLVPLAGGQVRLAGADPRRLSAAARARLAAYLPQARPLAWPLRVRDVVALGRYAYGAAPARLAPADAAAVARALAACDLEDLAERPCDRLSGGELARVHVARALAQDAPLLVADEPTAALDPRHALGVMRLIRAFTQRGGAALVVVHDLALAARFACAIVVLSAGRVIGAGAPEDVLSPDMIASAFGVRAAVAGRGEALTITFLEEL